MSKNQIWVGIVLVGVVILFLVSDIEIKVKIGDEPVGNEPVVDASTLMHGSAYKTEMECALRESQECEANYELGKGCGAVTREYCAQLFKIKEEENL